MSALEESDEDDAEATDDAEKSATVPVTDDLAVSLPDDATGAESAAIAAAIGAHLTDRQRAAAASEERETPDADRWKLDARLRPLGRRRYPRDVERGEEWKAAARSF